MTDELPGMCREYYDAHGKVAWSMDEHGFLTRLLYDAITGALIQRIEDVDTAKVSDPPPGWSTPADGGLHIITDSTYDAQGRILREIEHRPKIDLNGTPTTLDRAYLIVFEVDSSQTWTAKGFRALPSAEILQP